MLLIFDDLSSSSSRDAFAVRPRRDPFNLAAVCARACADFDLDKSVPHGVVPIPASQQTATASTAVVAVSNSSNGNADGTTTLSEEQTTLQKEREALERTARAPLPIPHAHMCSGGTVGSTC